MTATRIATRPRVLVARAGDQTDDLMAALSAVGLEGVSVPAIVIEAEPAGGRLDDLVRQLDAYRWVVVTSPNGARAVLDALDRVDTPTGPGDDSEQPAWAAIGSSTRMVVERRGRTVAFEPSTPTAATLAAELPVRAGEHVLVARGDLAGDATARVLRGRGATVDDVVAYRTREAPEDSRALLAEALAAGPIVGVILTSGSTARGFARLAADAGSDVTGIPAICIGQSTATEARRAGFEVVAVSSRPDLETLARTAASALSQAIQEKP